MPFSRIVPISICAIFVAGVCSGRELSYAEFRTLAKEAVNKGQVEYSLPRVLKTGNVMTFDAGNVYIPRAQADRFRDGGSTRIEIMRKAYGVTLNRAFFEPLVTKQELLSRTRCSR